MQNMGKRFEQNWRQSLPDIDNLYYYRLKDGTANWSGGGNINVRFQANNIADAFMLHTIDIPTYNSELTYLLILEFKHHKGKSLPLSCIRDNQLEEMTEAGKKKHVIPLIIAFFSDVCRCFALRINYVNEFIENNERKSIPIDYFEEHGTEIDVKPLKTNYRFDIGKFLEEY